MSTPRTTIRRPGGRTRRHTERIHAATVALLIDGGYAAVTFQTVAEQAAVSRATMYRRWLSRAGLVADAVRAAVTDAIEIPDTGSLHGDLSQILRHTASFITSPIGAAALAAGLEIGFGDDAEERRDLWDRRSEDFAPVFDTARARGEIDSDFDDEAVLAMTAGAVYHRILVMGRPVDDDWITRVVDRAVGPVS